MIATLITLAMLYAPAKDEVDPYWFLPPHERPKNEEVVEQKPVVESVPVVQMASGGDAMTYAGCYELTAYIATGNPCSSGVYPTVGRTVACNSIPLGTTMKIQEEWVEELLMYLYQVMTRLFSSEEKQRRFI